MFRCCCLLFASAISVGCSGSGNQISMDLDIATDIDPAIYSFLKVCSESMSGQSNGVEVAKSLGWVLDDDPSDNTITSVQKTTQLSKDMEDGSYIIYLNQTKLKKVTLNSCQVLLSSSFNSKTEDPKLPNLLEISENLGVDGALEPLDDGFQGFWSYGNFPNDVFVSANATDGSGGPRVYYTMSTKHK